MKNILVITLIMITLSQYGKAQSVSIPDTNFKSKLISIGVDANHDGQISFIEAAVVDSLDIRDSRISNMAGINSFTSLIYLNCRNNYLDSLVLTYNTALTWLDCANNGYEYNIGPFGGDWKPTLTYLDISKNSLLSLLTCFHDSLTNLDLSNNSALSILDCSDSHLDTLDISENLNLKQLYCPINQLTQLDVSNNQALTTLWCGDNQLTSLVSKNPVLSKLDCGLNNLTSLDVSEDIALKELNCNFNKLTLLNTSNKALIHINCDDNLLTDLDISKDTKLESITCENNPISSLDVSKNINLLGLFCAHIMIESLDVSNNIDLIDLNCSWTQLKTLDVSRNQSLQTLDIQSIPTLTNVCVRILPPPFAFYDLNSPNVTYSTDCMVNIENLQFKRANFYPNPANSLIYIATSQVGLYSIKLINLLGQEVLEANLSINDNYVLDVSSLVNGIYLLSIQNDKEKFLQKVIIQH